MALSLPSLSFGFEGGAAGSSADPLFNDHQNVINVAPVGVNLGQIVRELDSGPPATGGSGFIRTSPAAAPRETRASIGAVPQLSTGLDANALLMLALGVGLVFLVVRS